MQISTAKKAFFTKELLRWFDEGHRPLPWKGVQNPYFIWLSEVILQQTRVEQGLPYYEKFILKYPTIQDLADAPSDELMKLWEGLGYYSRARNLHETAKFVANELDGNFPTTYPEILKLKGVGEYTAAAIASFAYNLPFAVLDGNVFRVLARFFGIEVATDSKEGKKLFADLAQNLLKKELPANYNQAIMDFGATVCTPKNAQCKNCFLSEDCRAFIENKVEKLPFKSKKIEKRERFFLYFHFKQGENTWVNKRQAKDIWQDLYEFPMLELEGFDAVEDKIYDLVFEYFEIQQNEVIEIKFSKPFKQTLTHQHIFAKFIEIKLKNQTKILKLNNFICENQTKISKFAFPKIIDCYFQDNNLYLF